MMGLFDDEKFSESIRRPLHETPETETWANSQQHQRSHPQKSCQNFLNRRGMIIASALCCTLFIIIFFSFHSFFTLSNQTESTEVPDLIITNEYPQISSLDYLPWTYVVEPHKQSRLIISNPNSTAKYYWVVALDSESSEYLYKNETHSTPEINVVFTEAGSFYTIQVREIGGENRWIRTKAICKYVRREIRDLTKSDREKFLGALKTFYTISLKEGRELYGSNFFNYKEFTRLHLQENEANATDVSTCTPWHGGPTFVTSHLAMVLWVEQALQLIEPSIAIPYWDYIKDSVEYGTAWSDDSEVFTDDYFGAYQAYPYKLGGDWSDLPQAVATTSEDMESRYNSYLLMTDWYNNDNSTTVRRSNEVCGLKFETIGLPNCLEVDAVLETTSFTTARKQLEDGIHGRIHLMLGGVWDCGEDYGSILEDYDNDDEVRFILEVMLSEVQTLYSLGYTQGIYTDPGVCDSGIPFTECRFVCTGLNDTQIDSLTNEEVYNYLKEFQFLSVLSDSIINELPSGIYRFDVDSIETDNALKRHLLKLGCNPGRMSAFSTPLASTSDPIFLSTHSYYQRYWSYLLLTQPKFDMEWVDSLDCYGHRLSDELPWYGFLGENVTYNYTNADLLDVFDPSNPSLPYIHENFDWEFCKD